ncbi:AraC family transcriptional regulator [Planctomycetes bacterium TBK1r]|uniref:HTH-type transcriptional activator Btr n=1 Tax=Stieleria magnilauensis TaxID=2527963 RepID=A0ABX5XKH3_9BACT|nr:HTH-type transcriptional activator Btr [Planctomycetes bacterium TBK1r]
MNGRLMNPLESDPVTELLSKLYLPRWQAAYWHLPTRWGLEVPAGVVSMYVITRGGGWFVPGGNGTSGNIASGSGLAGSGLAGSGLAGSGLSGRTSDATAAKPIRVIAGDHLITTDGGRHQLVRELGSDTEPVAERLSDCIWPILPGPHDSTTVLYGQFELTGLSINPLAIGLPPLIHLNHRRDRELKTCLPLLDLTHQVIRDAAPGWQLTVRKLSELVLIQTIATQLHRNTQSVDQIDQSGLLRAMTDTVIGPVLKTMIETPESPWTVPTMAQRARVSKSAFSDRFRNLLGRAPLQYLTELRMQKARRLLRETDVEISHIATQVGYESPSSFSSVFKRWNDCSPAEFRRSRSLVKTG